MPRSRYKKSDEFHHSFIFIKMYYVYILYSRTKDRYYVGYTHNIEIRLSKHNAGATPSTRGGRPWELVYSEEYIDKSLTIGRCDT